jgi:hypothetical protein
VLVMEATVPKK